MSWVLVALIAYLFLALANLLDKFLIDNVISSVKISCFMLVKLIKRPTFVPRSLKHLLRKAEGYAQRSFTNP